MTLYHNLSLLLSLWVPLFLSYVYNGHFSLSLMNLTHGLSRGQFLGLVFPQCLGQTFLFLCMPCSFCCWKLDISDNILQHLWVLVHLLWFMLLLFAYSFAQWLAGLLLWSLTPIHSVQLLMLFLWEAQLQFTLSHPQITGSPWPGRAPLLSFRDHT